MKKKQAKKSTAQSVCDDLIETQNVHLNHLRRKFDQADANDVNEQVELMQKISKNYAKLEILNEFKELMGWG